METKILLKDVRTEARKDGKKEGRANIAGL